MNPLPFSGAPAYAWIFWSAYACWAVLEMLWSRTKRSSDRSRDRGSLRLVIVLLWVGLGLDFWLSFALPQAAITWKRPAVFFAGIGLMLGGVAFRYYAVATLGRFFTFDVAVQSGQKVIEAGPYRYIRHPAYTGTLTTLLGLGLALGNWVGLVALLAPIGAALAYRIRVEETALLEAIGEPYRQYMGRTKRLVPFLF